MFVNRIFFDFCAYKNFSQEKLLFVYKCKITMTAIGERQRANFCLYKKQEILLNVFIYKIQTLFKKQDSSRYVLFKKSLTINITRFFMKILNLIIVYKKHDNLRYVTCLYTRSQTLQKQQDNLCYVFIYKMPDTLRYAIFHWMFGIGGGGGHFYI